MADDTNAQVTIARSAQRLDAATVSQVRTLAARAAAADGVAPLSEQPLLRLVEDGAPAVHLLARAGDGTLVGYAQVELADTSASAELVVDPEHRRRGTGRALLDAAATEARAGGAALRVWAHGDLPAARALATAAGLAVVRDLWRMRLALADRGPARPLPPGTTLRAFVPGRDEQAWVHVNARAFAHHPEQGRLTVADVAAREREPWFAAEDFLLAEREGALVGFVWTKVEPGADAGELYAVGVDPDAQGLGLGAALTSAALDHLARRGLVAADLYVDGDNTAAVRTYTSQGFVRAAVDVMLAPDTDGSPAGVTMGS